MFTIYGKVLYGRCLSTMQNLQIGLIVAPLHQTNPLHWKRPFTGVLTVTIFFFIADLVNNYNNIVTTSGVSAMVS